MTEDGITMTLGMMRQPAIGAPKSKLHRGFKHKFRITGINSNQNPDANQST